MNKSLLKHYAKALFEESIAKGRLEEVYQDFRLVKETFDKEKEFSSFLDSRQVPLSFKDKILDQVFLGKIETMTLGYLHIVTKNHLSRYMDIMEEEFHHMYNQSKGILEGLIYTGYLLEDSTIVRLENVFSKKYGKNVHFHMILDKRVIAGMKININDTLYDYTIDSKIENVKKKLLYSGD